jgi:hypothetical protein
MNDNSDILTIISIPPEEKAVFDSKIKQYREKYIRKSDELVNEIYEKYPELLKKLDNHRASEVIDEARELVWQQYLIEEANFNAVLLRDMSETLNTPKKILETLIENHIGDKTGSELKKEIMRLCGEYAGRVSPYIYTLCLSNTQSRRSRSGSSFQSIVYRMYTHLGYPFNSQKKVGKTVFSKAGLGKIVDAILPGVDEFTQRRSKTIIATMKTSLRERWQEVNEEMQRTNIPQIFLLTVDTDISQNKAKQMNEHNITLVVTESVMSNPKMKEMKNIISFENFLFEEIPNTLSYWKQ